MNSSMKIQNSKTKGKTKGFKIHNHPLEPNYCGSWQGGSPPVLLALEHN